MNERVRILSLVIAILQTSVGGGYLLNAKFQFLASIQKLSLFEPVRNEEPTPLPAPSPNESKTESGGSQSEKAPAASSPSPQAALSPQMTPTPQATPTAERISIIGTWRGNFADLPATLNITEQTDDSFSGSLTSNGCLIAIGGKISHIKRTLNWRDMRRLNACGWTFTTNVGAVSSNGRTMTGTGRGYRSFRWTFSKQ